MTNRREFSRKQRAEIILRATGPDGVIVCEGCGLRLGKKPFEIDHIIAEALIVDKSAPLSIAPPSASGGGRYDGLARSSRGSAHGRTHPSLLPV